MWILPELEVQNLFEKLANVNLAHGLNRYAILVILVYDFYRIYFISFENQL